MIMKRLVFIGMLFLVIPCFSQKNNFKFGNISKEELTMKTCEFYPEANSMILADIGNLRFKYDNDHGFQYHFEVVRRLKIFNKVDKDAGSISIRVYEPENKLSGTENLLGLKATTYNLIDGKIVKDKLPNNQEFKTRLNDYWVEYSFAMPNVKEGSVIEYKYSLESDFISNLKTWYFQNDIPTAYSEYSFTIPEYYIYNTNFVGNVINLENETRNPTETFTYKWSNGQQAGGSIEKGTSTLTSNSTWNKYIGRNVLPIEEEPFMNNKNNLPSRLEFQLISIQYPNSARKIIAGNYEKFNNDLIERESFGKILEKNNFAKDFVSTLEGKSEIEKVAAIHNWIKYNMQWNKVNGFTSSQNGNETMRKKEGNVAAINLALVSAWRAAGIEAYPVILNLRGHGLPHPVYPNYQDFNYVVGAAIIDGKIVYGDAISNRPVGNLPEKCMNGNGWMVSEKGGRWINLKEAGELFASGYIQMYISDDAIKAEIKIKHSSLLGAKTLDKYKELGEEEFKTELTSGNNDWQIQEFNFDELKNMDQVTYNYVVNQEIEDPDIVYLKPVLLSAITENPFVREKRISPVDFSCSQISNEVVIIHVPEGYEVELPKPAVVKLPDNGGTFIYNTQLTGNTINVVSKYSINKLDFSPDEYSLLSQFFKIMAEKNNELVVLKKL